MSGKRLSAMAMWTAGLLLTLALQGVGLLAMAPLSAGQAGKDDGSGADGRAPLLWSLIAMAKEPLPMGSPLSAGQAGLSEVGQGLPIDLLGWQTGESRDTARRAPASNNRPRVEVGKAPAPALSASQAGLSARPVPEKRLNAHKGLWGAAWIKAKPPKAFTLQLLGARKPETLQAFVKAHRLEGDLAYFKGTFQGKPWYSLIHGVYPTYREALEEAHAIEARIGVKPWIRRYGDIQRRFP